ncbi:LapA family protein [Streptomyces sp. NPDC096048]|uniref:LapA family protein n=1 Tax=Streptomyces sp. NPDC096048 TaxID=3366072 RepID=UPI003808FCEC
MCGRKTPGASDGPRRRAEVSWRDRFPPSRWLALVLVAVAVVLIVENNRQIRIRLLVPVVTMPLYLALLIMFGLGGVCGALLVSNRRRSRR